MKTLGWTLALAIAASAGLVAQRAPCTGTLRDPAGTPIAAATVTFCQELSQTFGAESDRVEVETDSAGTFSAALLLGSPYIVWAVGPTGEDGARWVTSVSMSATGGKTLELIAARRARPHAVSLRGVTPWQEHAPPALRVLIGGNYRFAFDRPLAGDRTLQLGPWPGFEVELALVDDKRQFLCQVGPVGEDLGEVEFPPLRTVEVEAIDVRNTALEGVAIAVRPDRWRPRYSSYDPLPAGPMQDWRVVAWTDARGRAVLPIAWQKEERDISFAFAATLPGHEVALSGIRGGMEMFGQGQRSTLFHFRMNEAPQRRVRWPSVGNEAPGRLAVLSSDAYYLPGGGPGRLDYLAATRVGDGLASLPAVGGNEPARGFVRLPPRDNAPARVCLGEAWDNNDVEVVLQTLSQRRLVVRDAAGQSVPFAPVVIAHRFGTQNEFLFLHDRCVTDRDGRVDLMSSAGTWDIIAVTDNGMGWSRIEEDDAREEVPIALLPIGSARFRVVDGDGNPVPDARLADNPGWVDYPDDYLLRQVALHLALSQRSDHDGMLVVPMPYGEFRETRIVRGQQQTWRQTVRAGDGVKTVVMR